MAVYEPAEKQNNSRGVGLVCVTACKQSGKEHEVHGVTKQRPSEYQFISADCIRSVEWSNVEDRVFML